VGEGRFQRIAAGPGRLPRVCLAAATLAVLGATLAGCGGGTSVNHDSAAPTATIPHKRVALDKAAYERTMRRLGTQLIGSVDSLFPLTEAQPGTDVSKATLAKLERTRTVVTSVMATAAGIVPPPPIRAAHRQLLQGVSDLGREIDNLIQAEEKGPSKPFGLYTQFNSLRTIAKATSAIEKKGYKIG